MKANTIIAIIIFLVIAAGVVVFLNQRGIKIFGDTLQNGNTTPTITPQAEKTGSPLPLSTGPFLPSTENTPKTN